MSPLTQGLKYRSACDTQADRFRPICVHICKVIHCGLHNKKD